MEQISEAAISQNTSNPTDSGGSDVDADTDYVSGVLQCNHAISVVGFTFAVIM